MEPNDLHIAAKVAGPLGGSVEFIDAGFSKDRKFRIQTGEGSFLLRISAIDEERQRRFEFESISALYRAGFRCARAVQFSLHDAVCCGLYEYIEGECGYDRLPALSASVQHGIGLESGEQLRRMHGFFVAPEPVDEYFVRGGKFHKHVAMLADLGYTFSGQETALDYAEQNLHLLKNRPTTFRHGDYHPGNLIIREGHLAGIIDFNRCDFGDPYDDFYKTPFFGAPVSPDYARGLLIGYFEGDPPDTFWPLYNVFVAAVLPADIIWSYQLFPHLLEEAFERVERITRTHDFRGGGPPEWW